MTSPFKIASLLVSFLLLGCGLLGASVSSEGEPVDGRATALIGGAEDPGHAYVVAVGDHLCTGSLVSARTVLTAAHCLAPGATIASVSFGPKEGAFFATVPVVETRLHPENDAATHRSDLLLLKLAADAPVPPVPLFRDTLTDGSDFIGPPLTFVGFGRTVWIADTSGTKRVVTFPVDGLGPATVGGKIGSIDETMFFYSRRGEHTCNGDSGGPSFLVGGGVERQVGVTSHGEVYCRDVGVQARVDRPQLSRFLQPTIDAFEPDNRCRADGVCTNGCERDGQTWDPDCQERHCGADGVCAVACVRPVDPDCAFLNVDHCGRDGVCDPGCPSADVDCAG